MLHGASNTQPHLAGLGGGQGIRHRCVSQSDGVLVRGEPVPVAALILDCGEADSLAQPLRPPEDRFRLATLLSLLVEPDAADLREFVSACSIPREPRDDQPDERFETQKQVLSCFACSRLMVVVVIVAHGSLLSGRVRVASVTVPKSCERRSGKAGQLSHYFVPRSSRPYGRNTPAPGKNCP